MKTLAKRTRNQVIDALQRQTANGFALYYNYKRYHWNTHGPLFRDLHLLFDDHAAQVLQTIDDFAERIRILGGVPVATPRDTVEHQSVQCGRSTDVAGFVREAVENHRKVIEEMRVAVDAAQGAGDPGTADVFTRLVQVHEKQEWFLREILEKQDGLVT